MAAVSSATPSTSCYAFTNVLPRQGPWGSAGPRGPGASVPGPSAHRRRPVPGEQRAPTAPAQPPALGSTCAQRGKSADRYLGDHEAIGVVSQQTVAVVLCGSHFLPRWSGFEGPGVSWLWGAQGRPAARGCGRPGGRAGRRLGTRAAPAGTSSPWARSALCSGAGRGTRGRCAPRGRGCRRTAGPRTGTGQRLRGRGDTPPAPFA